MDAQTTVIVFETHPAIRSGIVQRLEAEPDVVVLAAFSDVRDLEFAVRRMSPDVVVVGMFGPHGVAAANRVSSTTRVLAMVPDVRDDETTGLLPGTLIVRDSPRGHRITEQVRNTITNRRPHTHLARPRARIAATA